MYLDLARCLCKWFGRILFFLLLCAVIILSIFLSASRSQYSDLKDDFDMLADKYNYTVNALLYNKKSLYRSL